MKIGHAAGGIRGIVSFRLEPGCDVLEGIERVCREREISCAAVLSAIGSLRRARLFTAVPLPNKAGGGYGEPIAIPGPLELVCAQGTVGREEDGAPYLHVHAVVSDGSARSFGGHLIAGSAPVLVTCEVTLGVIAGIEALRSPDPAVEMKVLGFRQSGGAA